MKRNSAELKFLNDSLTEYFKGKKYSVIGLKSRIDSLGSEYKTYAMETFDIPVLTHDSKSNDLGSRLESAKKDADILIYGLIVAKQHEKPEGGLISVRDVEVHFRQFPEIDFLDGDHVMALTMRISLHHKQGQA